jgi:hypothetical protein
VITNKKGKSVFKGQWKGGSILFFIELFVGRFVKKNV